MVGSLPHYKALNILIIHMNIHCSAYWKQFIFANAARPEGTNCDFKITMRIIFIHTDLYHTPGMLFSSSCSPGLLGWCSFMYACNWFWSTNSRVMAIRLVLISASDAKLTLPEKRFLLYHILQTIINICRWIFWLWGWTTRQITFTSCFFFPIIHT